MKYTADQIEFLDITLLPLVGLKSIADYETRIYANKLSGEIVKNVNNILSKFKKVYQVKEFNLHKTNDSIRDGDHLFNFIKKCFIVSFIPYEINKDSSGKYMRLITQNNLLNQYIYKKEKMSEIRTKTEEAQADTKTPLKSVDYGPQLKVMNNGPQLLTQNKIKKLAKDMTYEICFVGCNEYLVNNNQICISSKNIEYFRMNLKSIEVNLISPIGKVIFESLENAQIYLNYRDEPLTCKYKFENNINLLSEFPMLPMELLTYDHIDLIIDLNAYNPLVIEILKKSYMEINFEIYNINLNGNYMIPYFDESNYLIAMSGMFGKKYIDNNSKKNRQLILYGNWLSSHSIKSYITYSKEFLVIYIHFTPEHKYTNDIFATSVKNINIKFDYDINLECIYNVNYQNGELTNHTLDFDNTKKVLLDDDKFIANDRNISINNELKNLRHLMIQINHDGDIDNYFNMKKYLPKVEYQYYLTKIGEKKSIFEKVKYHE